MSSSDERVKALARVVAEVWSRSIRETNPPRFPGAEEIAQALLDSPAMRDLLAEERAKALREAAEWLSEVGYPVEIRMPDNPAPESLWSALVDVIHEDRDGKWHGNELSREDVDCWLRDEAGA